MFPLFTSPPPEDNTHSISTLDPRLFISSQTRFLPLYHRLRLELTLSSVDTLSSTPSVQGTLWSINTLSLFTVSASIDPRLSETYRVNYPHLLSSTHSLYNHTWKHDPELLSTSTFYYRREHASSRLRPTNNKNKGKTQRIYIEKISYRRFRLIFSRSPTVFIITTAQVLYRPQHFLQTLYPSFPVFLRTRTKRYVWFSPTICVFHIFHIFHLFPYFSVCYALCVVCYAFFPNFFVLLSSFPTKKTSLFLIYTNNNNTRNANINTNNTINTNISLAWIGFPFLNPLDTSFYPTFPFFYFLHYASISLFSSSSSLLLFSYPLREAAAIPQTKKTIVFVLYSIPFTPFCLSPRHWSISSGHSASHPSTQSPLFAQTKLLSLLSLVLPPIDYIARVDNSWLPFPLHSHTAFF